jgi:hypothetical protein
MRHRCIKRFFISLGTKVLHLLFAVGIPIDHRLLGLILGLLRGWIAWPISAGFLGCHRRIASACLAWQRRWAKLIGVLGASVSAERRGFDRDLLGLILMPSR